MLIPPSDLSRWPIPDSCSPEEKIHLCTSTSHTLELMPIHFQWLEQCTPKYGFHDIDETLRHLIYLTNLESKKTKRLIFRIKRCLHCHVGARAGQHVKVTLVAKVYQFQWQWLQNVTQNCDLASVDKCVRILCDFYQSRVKEKLTQGGAVAADLLEKELFGTNRWGCDERLTSALEFYSAKAKSEENQQILTEDPSACSNQDILHAISRCQAGRKSASYAAAKGESVDETAVRRAKEQVIEQSEESQLKRELIRKALFM